MPRSRSSSLSSLDTSLHSYLRSRSPSPPLDPEEEEYLRAQKEWDEQVAQLQLLVEVMLLPFLGKWLGRRCSYWAYARWIRFGFSKEFFVGQRA